MVDSLDNVLLEAYELIEANRIDEARAMLTPLLSQHPENVDLWWVYAHAVADQTEARNALAHILELDPNFTDAAQLLSELENTPSTPPTPAPATPPKTPGPIQSLRKLDPPPPAPPSPAPLDEFADEGDLDPFEDDDGFTPFDQDFDGEFDEDDDFDEEADEGRNWLLLSLITVALLGISALVLFLALTNDSTPPPDPTQQIAVNPTVTPLEASSLNPTDTPASTEAPTEAATDTPAPTEAPTEAATDTPSPTDTPTPDPLSNILDSLSDFELSPNDPQIADTPLGETLVIEFCINNVNRQELLDSALTALAETDAIDSANAEAVAVALYDCERETTLRTIGTSLEDAQAFRAGDLDTSEFQLTWSVVG